VSGSSTLTSCRFYDNATSGSPYDDGGGLSCVESSVILQDCSFIGNSAHYGGGVHTRSSSVTLSNCTFTDNTAFTAGGFTSYSSTDALIGCVFDGNSVTQTGGAIDLTECSGVIIEQCTMFGNTASRAGAIAVSHGYPTVVGCTIYGNSGVEGGGITCGTDGHLQLSRSIICASQNGSAVTCIDGGSASLECCDLFDNAGGDWVGCIADQYGIEGNFSADPMFCDPGSNDFTLHCDSPCLPGNHPHGADCGTIGAHGMGCGATPAEEASWGRIKAWYR
jgi:hypothetical protein